MAVEVVIGSKYTEHRHLLAGKLTVSFRYMEESQMGVVMSGRHVGKLGIKVTSSYMLFLGKPNLESMSTEEIRVLGEGDAVSIVGK